MRKSIVERKNRFRGLQRGGAATLDYVLVLCVVLPMIAFVLGVGPRLIRMAYEMICVLIAWPFM
jgi:hypothetical protein